MLNELQQAAETGHDVTALRARFEGLASNGDDDGTLMAIYADIPPAPPARLGLRGGVGPR